MKLTIVMLAASALIKFEIPGPGSYSLYSSDGSNTVRVEMSGFETNACHVAKTVHLNGQHKLFWAVWEPAVRNAATRP